MASENFSVSFGTTLEFVMLAVDFCYYCMWSFPFKGMRFLLRRIYPMKRLH